MGYIVLLILSIAMFVFSGSFGFGRVFAFANFFSLLIIPIGIYIFLFNNSKVRSITGTRIIKLLGVTLIIFLITYFSIFTLFLSPITKVPNSQVPRSDYIGMSTFFLQRDESLPILEHGPVSNRFYDTIYGPSTPRLNIYFSNRISIPPDHFGYQNETLWGNLSHTPKYLLLNELGREFYPHMYPEFKKNWRFLAQDFERLKYDAKVQHVYSNKNLEVYLLTPT